VCSRFFLELQQLGQLELGQSSFHWIANPPSSSISSLQEKCDQDIPLIQPMFRVKSKKTALIVGNKPYTSG
jgi:hypothetical protein